MVKTEKNETAPVKKANKYEKLLNKKRKLDDGDKENQENGTHKSEGRFWCLIKKNCLVKRPSF